MDEDLNITATRLYSVLICNHISYIWVTEGRSWMTTLLLIIADPFAFGIYRLTYILLSAVSCICIRLKTYRSITKL